MKQILLITAGAIFAVSIVVFGLTYSQVNQERLTLSADLQYRTRILADSLKESVEPSYSKNSTTTLQRIVDKFADRERIVGLAVFNNRGVTLASSKDIPERIINNPDFVFSSLDTGTASGLFETIGRNSRFLFVSPLFENNTVSGALVIVQDSSYIDTAVIDIWKRSVVRLLVQIFVFTIAIVLLARWALYNVLNRFADSVKSARMNRGSKPAMSGPSFLKPLASEISKMHMSLTQARFAASEEARMRLEKLDSPWTSERLSEFIKASVKDRKIFVISNREPYIHQKTKNEISVSVPASGMVTALEPIIEACGGMWIAWGSGGADKETADTNGKIAVPPDDPRYTLKRVWLTEKEVRGYYVGFGNEALWPLCHMAHTRPVFRKENWTEYKRVNAKFAESVLAEIKNVSQPIILVQDFHLALLPQLIKEKRPDAQIGIFWHIPWPSAEHFSICPWRKELLTGMLGADVVGFHTQQYCNNFMDTVGKEVESLIDLEQFAITRDEHRSFIKPFPISIAFTSTAEVEGADEKPGREILAEFGVHTPLLGLGVDRLDYTKGIVERFKGIEYFLEKFPAYKERFTFLQIAPVSRAEAATYQAYALAVTVEAERINQKFGTRDWKPIVLHMKHHPHNVLYKLYRLADLCLVTSLHDGMNLVAKEFVAARTDEHGVLILSNFTGASRDLKGALLINPYSAEDTAEAINVSLTMPGNEQRRRMKLMRDTVKNYNVYRWSAEFIKALISLE
ncbi:MAG: trehalose-6-phosphate synthase [Candidatus Taylorbacteria bacterium CG11_big_fil_rev_8_21_14_0_20_46_11]|uniref:Trehalose-6-phosphate synthase n=1 Tax=Candidatus Taylorbacteria bacterium CG11_big_fil_rev_8_21_14_0_20_46_11 TaxID=1975025 RepID=A0A2H0KA91_9BACT|nr:MAG: trehalose-6-phosphate synthase [Candidatus Taylorbacteria bacterium CG11_big_fil_rev_8_21_14_0_20_46_11]